MVKNKSIILKTVGGGARAPGPYGRPPMLSRLNLIEESWESESPNVITCRSLVRGEVRTTIECAGGLQLDRRVSGLSRALSLVCEFGQPEHPHDEPREQDASRKREHKQQPQPIETRCRRSSGGFLF